MESKMIKLMDLLKEEKQKFEFGCAMLYFDFPEMSKVQNVINPEDAYTEEGDRSFGFEDEPHTTLLFGLHEEVSDEDVINVLDKFKFGTCKLFNASIFNNPQYDVFKFNVKGPSLHETNAELTKYPHTTNFPDYHPHATIAYLKPGTGKKYVEMLKGQEFELTPTHAVYSKPNGDKIELQIKLR